MTSWFNSSARRRTVFVAAVAATAAATAASIIFVWPSLSSTDPSRLSNQTQIISTVATLAGMAVAALLAMRRNWVRRPAETPPDHRLLLADRVFKVETATLQMQDLIAVRLKVAGDNRDGHDIHTTAAAVLDGRWPRLVVLGEAGAGKTVLCTRLVLKLIEAVKDENTLLRGLVPVRIDAATWTDGRKLSEWMAERIEIDYGVPSDVANALVRNRQIMPFIDGLDELDSPVTDEQPTQRQRATSLVAALNRMKRGEKPHPVAISCRLAYYRALGAGSPGKSGVRLAKATQIELQPLSPADIRRYITLRYGDNEPKLATWKPVLDRIDLPSGSITRRVLATPWHLELATTVVPIDLSPDELLTEPPGTVGDPDLETKESDRVVDTLLRRFIPSAVKIAAQKTQEARDLGGLGGARLLDQRYLALRPTPNPSLVESWMRAIARQQQRVETDPTASNESRGYIVPHLLWAVLPPAEVRAIHREWACWLAFFATAAVMLLLGDVSVQIMQAVGAVDGAGLGPWLRQSLQVVAVVTGLGVGQWVRHRCGTTRWPKLTAAAPVRVPLRHVARAALDGAGIGTLPYGLVTFVIASLLYGPGYGLFVASMGVAVCGLMNGTARAMAATSTSWVVTANVATPRRTVRRAGFVQLFHLLARASTSVVWFYLVIGLPLIGAAGVSLAISFVLFLATEDGMAVFRYRLGMTVAAVHHILPIRTGRFLEWATAIGLLRASGAAYQFRHRELYEWLAAESDPSPAGTHGD